MQIPQISNPKANIKQLVQDKLNSPNSGERLLIIDNADDSTVLFEEPAENLGTGTDLDTKCLIDYLPSNTSGSRLFTTRSKKAGFDEADGNVLILQELNPEEAKAMLHSTLTDKSAAQREDDFNQLLELLTFLPLAIVQAASYINQNDISISEYISLYQCSESKTIELLEEDFKDRRRYRGAKNAIATTWFISFEQIRKLNSLAAKHLSFMACLLRENIPTSLLPQSSQNEFINSIGILKAYAFITKRRDRDSFDMHRLVHLATQNWLRRESRDGAGNQLLHWTNMATKRLREGLKADDFLLDVEIWRAYLPHATYITGSSEVPPGDELRLDLLFKVGQRHLDLG